MKADRIYKNTDSRLLVSIIVLILLSLVLPISYAFAKTPHLDDGPDKTVNEGDEVTLQGEIWIDDVTYSWNQIDGIPVELSDSSSASPSFTAPDVDTKAVLTFQYQIIFEDDSSSNWATIHITINPSSGPSKPPDTTITSRVDGEGFSIEDESLSSYVEFMFTGEDDIDNPSGLSFECNLDRTNGDFQSCESPIEYTDLYFGEHEFQVRAIDEEGNVDLTPDRFAWTINEPPRPVSTITVHTDRSSSYTSQDEVAISGIVTGIVPDELVAIKILDPDNEIFYSTTQIRINQESGSYSSLPIDLESASEGMYIVQAEFNNADDETEFTVGLLTPTPTPTPTPDPEIIPPVDADDGTTPPATQCSEGYHLENETCVTNGPEIPLEIIIGSVAVVAGVVVALYKALERHKNSPRHSEIERPPEVGPGVVTVDVVGDIEDEMRGMYSK